MKFGDPLPVDLNKIDSGTRRLDTIPGMYEGDVAAQNGKIHDQSAKWLVMPRIQGKGKQYPG